VAVPVLLARLLFSALFILSGVGHLTQSASMAQYAAAKGVPAPRLAVLATGVMLVLGGLSVLLGLYVSVGALLLVVFLLPTAFLMHNFWTVEDPQARQNDQIHFMKDLALAGAAFLIWYFWGLVDVPLSITP
jgi:uncharacterized membrane protein YphA (DoxX/SURF4 family)